MKIKFPNYEFTKYTIKTHKLKKDNKKVICIADIHNYTKNKIKSNKLAEAIKERKPHHIVIAGDILQGSQWENKHAIKNFSYFLDNLSEESPVFISQGNHDLMGNNNNNEKKRIKNFKSLEKIRNGKVFTLINNLVKFDGFKIIGYTPNIKLTKDLASQENGIAHDKFIEDFNNNGSNIISDDNIIEFVGHDPYLIAINNNTGLGNLSNVDTFYTGHLHNGYINSYTTNKNPNKYLDNGYVEKAIKLYNKGKLIFSSINPLYIGKTNLCRGVIYINDLTEKKLLQLSNNTFYININNKWEYINNYDALNIIQKEKLHPLVITGGISKFWELTLPFDKPEITEITYTGYKEKTKKLI